MTQRRNGPRVGVFGLGSMGGGMARVLDRAGFAVLGFDVCPDAVARFAAAGGAPASRPPALHGPVGDTADACVGRPPATRPKATVRVDLERIDRLLNLVGDLVINQAMLSHRARS
jgi:6-phosphogluconate dehydrogenase (decarboxylating)